jgi:hypothetical protein
MPLIRPQITWWGEPHAYTTSLTLTHDAWHAEVRHAGVRPRHDPQPRGARSLVHAVVCVGSTPGFTRDGCRCNHRVMRCHRDGGGVNRRVSRCQHDVFHFIRGTVSFIRGASIFIRDVVRIDRGARAIGSDPSAVEVGAAMTAAGAGAFKGGAGRAAARAARIGVRHVASGDGAVPPAGRHPALERRGTAREGRPAALAGGGRARRWRRRRLERAAGRLAEGGAAVVGECATLECRAG